MISITTQISSSYVVVLQEDPDGSKLDRFSRRVSRRATLDGDAVVNDSGYSDMDRTLIVEAEITEAQKATLEYMIKTYSRLNISSRAGFFVCAPENIEADNGQLKLTLLVAE
ncbi:MAG: hypothetical protein JRF53_00550 [Deltaproteobacteria bacterium]|nr:hypothetical protein [Deltaproteobacteria bacterium]